MKKSFIAAVLLAAATFASNAEIRLPALISDGMVLQRESTINIWGKAEKGKTLSVFTSWDKSSLKAVPDADGSWQVKARTPEAGGPYYITVSQGREKVTVSDVMIGEVWLCSGQSNMQMHLKGYDSQPVEGSFEAILQSPSQTNLRLFHVPLKAVEGYAEDVDAKWEHSGIGSAEMFSAIGYFFGEALADNLSVTVGMIESDWGGTKIESWMSEDRVRAINPEHLQADSNLGTLSPNRTAILWKSMIYPMSRYAIRGFLWYQGESNVGPKGYLYDKLMQAMVDQWRSEWQKNGTVENGEDLAFLYAQISPFDYNNPAHWFGRKWDISLPIVWEAQMRALSLIPNSDMAVNVDLGSATYIHPSQKKVLADRFLMLAMHDVYGASCAGTDWRGPIFKSVEFTSGKAVVEFETVSTLCPADPFIRIPVKGFEIAGADRVFHPAEAYVANKTYKFSRKVEVSSPEVPEPVAVRYAFDNLPGELNLTSSQGLPAFPFRTDNWDDVD